MEILNRGFGIKKSTDKGETIVSTKIYTGNFEPLHNVPKRIR